MHLNNQCYFPNLDDLFILEDITDVVQELIPEVELEIKKLKKVASSQKMPQQEIGPHCSDPYDCPYIDVCWKDVPDNNIFQLPGVGKKAWDLWDKGLVRIEDLDANDFSGKTRRAIEVVQTKKGYLDKSSVRDEIKSWQWPFYFFDFETIGPAIPRYTNTKPFSQVPFQYSCHVQKSLQDETLDHFEYLHTDETDPREAIAKSIVENFADKGSVVAYNKGFEKGVLQKLAEHCPQYADKLNNIIERLVDPLPIFRNYIYHEDFKGSFSIKYVAPALIGEHLKYSELEVSDGSEAQAMVNLLMTGKISDPKEKEKVTQALLEYCRQDTMAMVELVRWLFKTATSA